MTEQRLFRALSKSLLALPFLLFALPIHPRWILVSLAVAVSLVYANWPERSVNKKPLLLLALFAISSLASAFNGPEPIRSLTITATLFPGLLASYVLATRLPRVYLNSVPALLTLAASALSASFIAVAVMHPAETASSWMIRASYPHLSVPNDLIFLAIVSPLITYTATSSATFALRATGITCLFLIFVCIILYQSRGGLITLFIALTLIAPGRKLEAILKFAATATLICIVIDYTNDFKATEKITSLSTLTTRLPLWKAAWGLFLESPWLGSGPGAFSILYEPFIAYRDLPPWILVDQRHAPWAHSLYLELLSERGVIGSLLLAGVAWTTFQLLSKSPQPSAKIANTKMLGSSVRASMLAMLFVGVFELSIIRLWVSLLICIFITMSINISEDGENEGNSHRNG